MSWLLYHLDAGRISIWYHANPSCLFHCGASISYFVLLEHLNPQLSLIKLKHVKVLGLKTRSCNELAASAVLDITVSYDRICICKTHFSHNLFRISSILSGLEYSQEHLLLHMMKSFIRLVMRVWKSLKSLGKDHWCIKRQETREFISCVIRAQQLMPLTKQEQTRKSTVSCSYHCYNCRKAVFIMLNNRQRT